MEDGDGTSKSAPAGGDNVEGTRKRKPDAMLEHFVAVLSPEQKQQLLGLLGGPTADEPIKTSRRKAARAEPAVKPPPTKKARRDPADAPAQRASTATATTPATSTMEGCDEQRDSDVGVGRAQSDPDPTVRKDTTGTYRVAYNWPQKVQQLTVDWIIRSGLPSYYKPLERVWEARRETWTIGVPCPPATVVHTWVRADRKARQQQAGEHPPLTKQVMQTYNAVSMRVVQEKMGASSDQRTKEQLLLQSWKVAMNRVLQHCIDNENGKSINSMLRSSKGIYNVVTAASTFPTYMARSKQLLDFRRLVEEHELSQRLSTKPPAQQYESQRQIPVLFPNMSDNAAREVVIVIGSDVVDSLSNLGDGLPCINSYNFLGKGSYGAAFEMVFTEGHDSGVLKIFWKAGPLPLPAVAYAAGNEFAMNTISQIARAQRTGKATRTSLSPFALGVIDTPGHPFQGLQCLALPSKEKPGYYYAALFSKKAFGSLRTETKRVSKELFSDKRGKVEPSAFKEAAMMMKCAFQAVKALHSYGGSHRDLKPDNFFTVLYDAESEGDYFKDRDGTKKQVLVGDLGECVVHCMTAFTEKPQFSGTSGGRVKGNGKSRGREVLEQHLPRDCEQRADMAAIEKMQDGVSLHNRVISAALATVLPLAKGFHALSCVHCFPLGKNEGGAPIVCRQGQKMQCRTEASPIVKGFQARSILHEH